jgi:hypothetical protein
MSENKNHIGKISEIPNYFYFFNKSKNALIRETHNKTLAIIRKNKELNKLRNELNQIKSDFDDEIYDLKEFINLQKEEILQLMSFKIIKKTNIIKKTYLMKDKHSGLYKIGYSKNPKFRETTLQSENPSIKMVKVWDKNIESFLHEFYKDFRIRGEWFKLTEIQVKYICLKF